MGEKKSKWLEHLRWQRPVPGAQGQLHAVTPNAVHVLQEGEGE